jgi:hypothetical protein
MGVAAVAAGAAGGGGSVIAVSEGARTASSTWLASWKSSSIRFSRDPRRLIDAFSFAYDSRSKGGATVGLSLTPESSSPQPASRSPSSSVL